MVAASATDTINITGTWSGSDTTQVTWNKAVSVRADSDSKQVGRPWKTGDTTYRHKIASGHSFLVSANVDIEDITIESDSTGVSDELFRMNANITTMDIKRCHLGFSGTTSQQDIVYVTSAGAAQTTTFEQCFFYDVERTVVDDYRSDYTYTVNFNSCASYNVGITGRQDASWYGYDGIGSHTNTITVNIFNCLLTTQDIYICASNNAGTANGDAPYNISETVLASIFAAFDTTDTTGSQASHTWVDTDSGAGDYVVFTDITTSPYNPILQDLGNSKNEAQDTHAVSTDAGLTIPSTDIVGTSRPQNTDYDTGPYEIGAAESAFSEASSLDEAFTGAAIKEAAFSAGISASDVFAGVTGGRIMGGLAGEGGLAGRGGIAGRGGGLAG